MKDKENVISHMQIIHTWAEFAREYDVQFFTAKILENIAAWADDAITLLEEQDKEISRISNAYLELLKVASKKHIGRQKTACDGCENKGSEDCALGKPGSENAYCPNGKLR